jgi:hypothetical protein
LLMLLLLLLLTASFISSPSICIRSLIFRVI